MFEEFVSYGIAVSRFYIDNADMSARLNRPIGHYSTLNIGPLTDDIQSESICGCLTEELRRYLFPYKGKTLFVCGIGNDRQIADSFGPETAKRIVPQIPMQSYFEKVV